MIKTRKELDIQRLKKLAIYGSPAARAAAITILDEMLEGKLIEGLKKLDKGLR